MNNNTMEEMKKLHWHKMDASIVNIEIKGKELSDVYRYYSDAKSRSYMWCMDKMNRFIDEYELSLINYGITGSNCNFYTFEFLLQDELDNKYLVIETAYSSKYYTSNEQLLITSRRYHKQLNTQK